MTIGNNEVAKLLSLFSRGDGLLVGKNLKDFFDLSEIIFL